MKHLFFVANWKSNKTLAESLTWLDGIKDVQFPQEYEAIICVPFVYILPMQTYINEHSLRIKLGVQNVSPFAMGAYTGEVNALQLKSLVTHVIVGHSERRKYFGENDEQVIQKIERLLENMITPILCISDMNQLTYYLEKSSIFTAQADKIIYVYEPPGAISGGGAYHEVKPEDIHTNSAQISEKIGKKVITLYGGSMNPQNSAGILSLESIDGGLIGQASLDPISFYQLMPTS